MAKKLPSGIQRSGKTYRIQFRSRHTNPGMIYSERLPQGTTLRSAEAYLAKLREEDRQETLQWRDEKKREKESHRIWTIGDFATEIYLPHCAASNRPSTLERKVQEFKRIGPWFWDLRLDGVDAATVSRFAAERKAEGVRARTVNIGIAQIKHLLNVAHELGFLIHPPPKFRRLPEKDKKSVRWLSRDEIELALANATAKGEVWRALCLFLLGTGARWGETRALRWSDLDLEEGIVTFHGHTTKGGKDRMIPLLPEVVSALASLTRLGDLVFMHRWREKVCPMPVDGKLGGDVYPWDGEGLSASPHVLRHTFAAMRLRGGVGMEKVQKWLGHSTISLTVDTYGHIVPEEHAEEIAKGYHAGTRPTLRAVK
ncbi:site-specific integrase [Myxococcota bacterium]|nr:site-specific integrase [Myxococcota bacterium]